MVELPPFCLLVCIIEAEKIDLDISSLISQIVISGSEVRTHWYENKNAHLHHKDRRDMEIFRKSGN